MAGHAAFVANRTDHPRSKQATQPAITLQPHVITYINRKPRKRHWPGSPRPLGGDDAGTATLAAHTRLPNLTQAHKSPASTREALTC